MSNRVSAEKGGHMKKGVKSCINALSLRMFTLFLNQ